VRDGGPYRGLLIDFGGVLTTDVFASFAAFCAAAGLEPDALAKRFRHDREARDLLIALEDGRLAPAEFERRLAPLLGVAPEGLIERLMAGTEPDRRMIGAVRAARRAGVLTGLVSNSWRTDRYDRALLDDMFDGVVLSAEVGVRKPAPRIYELGAAAVALAPAECVFVDDLRFNLEPAAALGMATVHHRDAAETIDELESLLGVALEGG
jgi:putative hydrolase of the HAD superfamily